jgi:1-deoxy-D-xylulose-5-phosphate reductoisomerase
VKTVSLVGSTGSIGRQTLDVVRAEPDRYRIVALGASTSVEQLAAQVVEFRPDAVAIADASREADLRAALPAGTHVDIHAGPGSLAAIAGDADVVVNGVVGFAGLTVTLAALHAGHRLALANKESLIAAGPVVARAKRTPGAEIVPVDSEHCAVHQCLRANAVGADGRPVAERVAHIVLTASGGPFRGRSRAELAHVTIEDALRHPTWSMGPKITVDSSTLMNKGLEVIEAHELFDVDYDRIQVVVHPQSIVHSMVEFTDGAVIAQLSNPDMRLPIGYALAYPDRSRVAFGAMDWTKASRLEFEPPDLDGFPCLGLAYEAGRSGGTAPAWLNAANEVAVAAFLDGMLPWSSIADVIKETLAGHDGTDPIDPDVVIEADRKARDLARRAVERRVAAA